MKISMRKMLVLLTIVLSFTAAQAVWAQTTYTVEGVVYSVSITESIIEVDEGVGIITTVYCIPFTHLANKHKIVLEVGDQVIISAYDRNFSDNTTKLVAVSLTAYNESGQLVTVQLR